MFVRILWESFFEIIWDFAWIPWESFWMDSMSKILNWSREKVFLRYSMRKIWKRSHTSSSSESAGSTWTRAALKNNFKKIEENTYFSHFDLKSGKQTENAELHNRSLSFLEVSSYCCWRSIPAILCVPFSMAFGLSICLKVML